MGESLEQRRRAWEAATAAPAAAADGSTPSRDWSTPNRNWSTPARDWSWRPGESSTPATVEPTPATDGLAPATDELTPTADGLTPTADEPTPAADGATPAFLGATPAPRAPAPGLDSAAPNLYRASMGHRTLTDAERAVLDARDAALTRRFTAREPAAEREMVERLDTLGFKVAMKLWPHRAAHWEEFRGAFFEVLGRYREEDLLRETEPLYFLAQRVMKQAGRKAGVEAFRDAAALRPDDPNVVYEPDKPGVGAVKLEAAIVAAAPARFANAEEALAVKEQVEWLGTAAESLAAGERATFEGVVAVAQDRADTLSAALQIAKPAARKRMQRLRAALAAFAAATGATEMLDRLAAAGKGAAGRAAEAAL
ncbi:MAG TPA: hypothetical protein VMB50_13350, partial [Myxococcales bacterium]|nr:hypothetical protein [Myxococcales bacterium]